MQTLVNTYIQVFFFTSTSYFYLVICLLNLLVGKCLKNLTTKPSLIKLLQITAVRGYVASGIMKLLNTGRYFKVSATIIALQITIFCQARSMALVDISSSHAKASQLIPSNLTTSIILISLLLLLILSYLFVVKLFQSKKEENNKKPISSQQIAFYNKTLEKEEKEKKRIANDLHDHLGQMLSLVKLNISELNDSVCTKNTEYKETLERSLGIIDEACKEVRSISHDLMPGSLISLGLISAINDLVYEVNKTTTINISFSTELKGQRFDEQLEIAYFRIIQELINNSVEHSHASKISISLLKKGDRLNLTVKDNGIGFNIETIENTNGTGWKNIKSRLLLINGQLELSNNNEWKSIVSIGAKVNKLEFSY